MTKAMIITAAGKGARVGTDKIWLRVGGKRLLAYSLELAAVSGFDRVVVVAPRERWEAINVLAASNGLAVTLTEGGKRRQDSVAKGLELCRDTTHVCIHDAARPLCSVELVQAVLTAAEAFDAATAAVAVVDTIKRVDGETVVETLDRSSLVAVQTPQAFATELLIRAHKAAADDGFQADDDAALVEHLGVSVHVVPGEVRNLKVTTLDDVAIVEALIAKTSSGDKVSERRDGS